MIYYALLMSAFAAFGKVEYVHCDTFGAAHMNVKVQLQGDLYHDDSDSGYYLMVRTTSTETQSLLEIVVESGSDRIFSTQQRVNLDSPPRTLFNDPVADFWLKCRVY